MRIGIIRTIGSPCRCTEAVVKGLESLGHDYLVADSEEIELRAGRRFNPGLSKSPEEFFETSNGVQGEAKQSHGIDSSHRSPQ